MPIDDDAGEPGTAPADRARDAGRDALARAGRRRASAPPPGSRRRRWPSAPTRCRSRSWCRSGARRSSSSAAARWGCTSARRCRRRRCWSTWPAPARTCAPRWARSPATSASPPATCSWVVGAREADGLTTFEERATSAPTPSRPRSASSASRITTSRLREWFDRRPREVWFAHRAAGPARRVPARSSAARCASSATGLALRFDDEALEAPARRHDPQPVPPPRIARRSGCSPRRRRRRRFRERVRREVVQRLREGEPGIAGIAQALATSERSLQRKLQAEGVSFRDVVDEARHKLAVVYLGDRDPLDDRRRLPARLLGGGGVHARVQALDRPRAQPSAGLTRDRICGWVRKWPAARARGGHCRGVAARSRRLLPRARRARRALRRRLLRRREDDRHLLPAGLPRRARRGATAAASSRRRRRPSRRGSAPCFRCRPELAPGAARGRRACRALVGRGDAPHRSGRAATTAALDDARARARRHRAATCAARCSAELGVTPVELAQSRRLALARSSCSPDTALPMTEVAFASGFRSVRRFNAAVPRALRLRRRRALRRARRRGGAAASTLDAHARLPPAATTGRRCSRFLGARAIARRRAGARRRLPAHRARRRARAAGSRSRRSPARRARCARRSRASLSGALMPLVARLRAPVRSRRRSPARSPRTWRAIRGWRRACARGPACACRARSTASRPRCAPCSASRSACAAAHDARAGGSPRASASRSTTPHAGARPGSFPAADRIARAAAPATIAALGIPARARATLPRSRARSRGAGAGRRSRGRRRARGR